MKRLIYLFILIGVQTLYSCSRPELYCVSGKDGNDLIEVLLSDHFHLHFFDTVDEVLSAAPEAAGVLILADTYPFAGTVITQGNIRKVTEKSLRVFVEYPDVFGSACLECRDTLNLERIVVRDSLSESLCPMDMMSFNRCIVTVLEDKGEFQNWSEYLVAAKVAGFDKAVYGLLDTPTLPVLIGNDNFIVSMTRISQFAHSRLIPEFRVKSLFEYIINWLSMGGELLHLMIGFLL